MASKVNEFVPPPSRLSKVLATLRTGYQPQLAEVKSLKLKYAFRNDHWGARHFVKNDVPRIRYANPKLHIDIAKIPKTKDETWKPEMVVELRDGTMKTLDMDLKWSSTIFQELMDIGGGPTWEQWKEERTAAGLPVVEIPVAKSKPQSQKEVLEPSAFNPLKSGAAAVLP